MADGTENEENEGKVDATSLLYIVGGIPAIVVYCVVLFLLTQWFNIPA